MLPVLADHDEVLIDPHADLAAGDLVLARHPFRKDIHMIKRLVRFETGGKAHLEGLNAEQSTDSRTLGDLPTDLLLGKVTSRF